MYDYRLGFNCHVGLDDPSSNENTYLSRKSFNVLTTQFKIKTISK